MMNISRNSLATPMRIAYLDCFSGISGDMFLGALLDAGVPFELFQKTVADLNIGATLELSRVDRAGISATKLDVVLCGKKDLPRDEFWADRQANGKSLEHVHPHYDQPGRRLPDILDIIGNAPVPDGAKQTASAIFRA